MNNSPNSLGDLAEEAFLKYVSCLAIHLTNDTKKRGHKHTYIQKICKHVADLICTVPPIHANEFTLKLLRCLEVVFYEGLWKCDFPRLRNIMSQLVKAVTHPSVTRLECLENKKHRTIMDYYKVRHSSLIFLAVPNLKNLKVLKLKSTVIYGRLLNDRDVSEKLEHVSIHGCKGSDLEVLSNYGKGVKSLHISDSTCTSLANSIVHSIFKFENLEELLLSEVPLTRRGQRKIFQGFAEMKSSRDKDAVHTQSFFFKTLSCSNPTNTDLMLLINKYPNLTSLSLSQIKCDLALLKDLKYLSNLSYKGEDFSFVEELLPVMGRQLFCLHFEGVRNLDFTFIVEHCPSVWCLDLELDCLYASSSCPNYLSVQCLHVYLNNVPFTEYLISHCVNVKKLYVNGCDMGVPILQSILKLRYLEECHWSDGSLAEENIFIQFSELYAVVDVFTDRMNGLHRKFKLTIEEMQRNSDHFFKLINRS